MLISPDHRLAVSNLGWVDKSGLWTYDASTGREALISVGDAKYLSIFACKDPGLFAALHHYDGVSIRLTVHSFEDPGGRLCTIERTQDACSVQGDVTAFASAPQYYVAYFDPGHGGDYYLLQVDAAQGELRAERFAWFDDSYDHAYQGIVGVLELPSGDLIVSIQRDSHPVMYDPATKRVVRRLSLANNSGNPTLRLAARRRELWADDYDTLLKLDLDSLTVRRSRRLQGLASGTSQFIGHWTFNENESLCLVPRPFSSDVLAISMETMKTKFVAKVEKQPFEAAFLNDDQIVARDWKTGQLLRSSLRKAPFFE
jgi:hypothetical protein